MAPSASETRFAYRPEIDGLRALAVAAVVLYHAGAVIPGGYAGVDVFFVISGFLIASIAMREVEGGRFRPLDFWERRVRRLLPAWFVAVALTSLAALVFLIPDHLADFGESLLAQPTLSANFHFWERTGYFEPESDWQPLLHTWSLAVEEQFYLFFPLLVPPLMKRGRRVASLAVLVLGLCSFALCLYTTPREPEFAFFLLPARIWELSLGIFLATRRPSVATSAPRLRGMLSAAGIAMIVSAFACFGDHTKFPGAAALLPCLGTALVIAANDRERTRTGDWLAARPAVWLGRISYPLYLWHWPCLAFLGYWSIDEPPIGATVGAVGLSLVLAWLTYRWIEAPVRQRHWFTTRPALLGVAAAAATLVAATGGIFFYTGGLPQRFPGLSRFGLDEIVRPKVATIEQWDDRGGPPHLGDPDAPDPGLLVWGDSHALALTKLFDELGRRHGVKVTVAAMAGVAPVPGTYPSARGADEMVHAERVLELIRRERFREVILIGKWPLYLTGRSDGELDRILRDADHRSDEPGEAIEVFLRRFPAELETLRLLGCRVTVMRSVPLQPHSVPEALARIVLRGEDPEILARPAAEHRDRDRRVNEILDRAVDGSEAVLVDPLPWLTDEEGICPMAEDGKALYRDRDHLSPYGSLRLAPLFEATFRELGGR